MPGRRRWFALAVVCLGYLMNTVDATIVNVALPSIQSDLHFTQANLTWVVNAYLITFGSFLLMAGRLGDLIGRKKVFLVGLVVFTVASAICGLATGETMLIVARAFQGLGSALASSVILAIIATGFRGPAERAKAMSLYMFVAVAGGSLGLLLGGVLTQSLSWHWIFFVNLPIGVLAFLLGSALIEENVGLGVGKGVDVLGSVLITAALMLGVYAIVTSSQYGWGSSHTVGFGGGAIVLLVAFFALEARLANPIMPLRILRLRSLIGSSAVRGLLVTGMFSSFFLGALYLEHVRAYGAIETGLAFLPMTVAVGILSLGISARLVGRFGAKRTLLPGLLPAIAGLLILSQAGEDASYFPGPFLAFLLIGIGAGTSFMPLLTVAMADVPRQDAGLASGIVNVSVQISGALGVAVLGTIATHRADALSAQGDSATTALTSGYHLAFVIAAVAVAIGVLVALAVLRSPDGGRAEPAAIRPTEAEAEAEAA
jgi:EmrB/QacA subfamily drug resistance transporter